ncbi:hypothetical protein HOG48_00880 [Candidatus Peregrinibacteria bacterium]|nr:hypothetical protein [Candidatus Peregrinibacteria bacterium]
MGAPEICEGLDDCPEVDTEQVYPIDEEEGTETCDGIDEPNDDIDLFPNYPEICDGIDNNCDSTDSSGSDHPVDKDKKDVRKKLDGLDK